MSSAAFSLKMGVKKGAAAKTHFATAPFHDYEPFSRTAHREV
jgi:hypothetical protein